MAKVEENKRLAMLSRQYSDFVISRDEFNKQRRVLLDEVDAKYNNRNYLTTEIMSEIKNRVKEVIGFIKNYKH